MSRTTKAVSSNQERGISVNTDFDLSELIVHAQERSVPLDQEVIRIGTRAGNDIVLEDGDIAGFHCEIWKQRDHHVLVHQASRQRTLLNGQPVEFRLIRPGDRIQIGEVQIRAVASSKENESDTISLEDVENLFEEDDSGSSTSASGRKLSEAKASSTAGQRSRSRASSPSGTGRSPARKELMLQIMLGLAGAIIVLLSLVHFFG